LKIKVRFFASLKEIAGQSETIMDVPEDISCEHILQHLKENIPALSEILESSLVAVNGTYVQKENFVTAEDEVAIMPPVSGG